MFLRTEKRKFRHLKLGVTHTLLQTSAEVCTDFAEVLTLGSAVFLFRLRTRPFILTAPQLPAKPKDKKISVSHKHNLLIVFDSLLASYKFSEAKLRIQF